MSSRKIKSLLAKKGMTPLEVYYERGCPTPYGFANGYSLRFSEETEEKVFDLKPELGLIDTYMEFDTAEQIYQWINRLPNLKEKL